MVTGYYYDWADRLTATTVTLAPGGAPPIVGTPLTTGNLTYDSHGNTVKLADQILTYDISDRHVGTTLTDGTTISYARDATGRIVSRTSTPPAGPVTAIRYLFTGDSLFGVSMAAGALTERDLAPPGWGQCHHSHRNSGDPWGGRVVVLPEPARRCDRAIRRHRAAGRGAGLV